MPISRSLAAASSATLSHGRGQPLNAYPTGVTVRTNLTSGMGVDKTIGMTAL